jgi:hypothetical protein
MGMACRFDACAMNAYPTFFTTGPVCFRLRRLMESAPGIGTRIACFLGARFETGFIHPPETMQ